MAASLRRPFEDPRFRSLVWAIVGITGWAGVLILGATLASQDPPRAGFDLNLILDAGRRVGSGSSPYLAGAVGNGTPVESLFFSYPPPVAQAASLLGGLSDAVVLVLLAILASVGFAFVTVALARGGRGGSSGIGSAGVVGPALALAPFAYPFAVALLFGNLDASFPFVYGAVLVAVTGGGRRWQIGSGVALGLVTLAKIHPGALLVWLAVAGLRARRRGAPERPAEWTILVAAVGTMVVAVAVSLAVGGLGPWSDYLGVVRSASQADLVTRLNIGPASQAALLFGRPDLAGVLAPLTGLAAIAVTALAAWVVRARGLSFSLAAIASLVVLPVTWFHYPVALLPVAVHAWTAGRGTERVRPVGWLLVAALLAAGVAIVAPVTVWLAVVLVVAAEREPLAAD